MNTLQLAGLGPHFVLSATSMIVMLVVAFCRSHRLTAGLSVLGLLGTCLALPCQGPGFETPLLISSLLVMDSFSVFLIRLILLSAIVVAILFYVHFEKTRPHHNESGHPEEFYILLLISTLGPLIMVSSHHMISFFLGLEILTIPLYAMISFLRTKESSLEAGIKYIILAGASTAFLLFGMALMYATLGTLEFTEMGLKLNQMGTQLPLLFLVGFGLLTVGLGFKLSAVPFHMWAPDIYQGASAPVTAYLATVSKGAVLAVVIRLFQALGAQNYPELLKIFSLLSILSMFGGNILALLQNNIKRLLAYSSVAHMGYMLVALVAGGHLGVQAILYYLVAYFATVLSAFSIIVFLSPKDRDLESLKDFEGLFWSHPCVAAVFTLVLLSLVGIPLTAGFIGKYFIVASGVNSHQWIMVGLLALNSAIGLYYYLKIVVSMFTESPTQEPGQEKIKEKLSVTGGVLLTALAIILLFLGLFPAPLLKAIQVATLHI